VYAVVESENQYPPKKRLRSNNRCDSTDSSSADVQTAVYDARLVVYDKQRRCLLTEGVYVLEMDNTETGGRGGGEEAGGFELMELGGGTAHKQTTWETVLDGQVNYFLWPTPYPSLPPLPTRHWCSVYYFLFINTMKSVLGIDIKLHPAVLPLLSLLGRLLSLQVQLGPIEVLVEMSMTRWWFGIVRFNTGNAPANA